MMIEVLQWLESSGLGRIARESLYGFQVLVGIHILGLILSVGTLLWVDVQMLGIGLKGQTLSEVYAALSKWFVVGFSIMILSGVALFAGFATSAYENTYFRVKMAVIVLAGINALTFHRLLRRLPADRDLECPTGFMRTAGFLSLVFWGAVIICGRLMSYSLF